MNSIQNSNALKFIAFFLVAIILLCLFGFTVDGWQINNNTPTDETPPLDDKPAEENIAESPKEPEIYIPKYVNALTGLETEAELSQKRHLAFIMDTATPLYGTSYSDLLIEFPVEYGGSRLASITNNYTNIGKIGSLTRTKDYISSVISAFNSIVIANGKDESVSYNTSTIPHDIIDLEDSSESKYTEFNVYTYTNGSLISQCINSEIISDTYMTIPSLPYAFPDFGEENVKGESIFHSITIPYSAQNAISLQYNAEIKEYSYLRNNSPQTDLLNGNTIDFVNCLVLFADSITFEDSSGLQMNLKTNEYGTGYFFTEGTAKEITWEYSNIGSLTLYDEIGSKLIINRGKTYIAFVKSSEKNNITLS